MTNHLDKTAAFYQTRRTLLRAIGGASLAALSGSVLSGGSSALAQIPDLAAATATKLNKLSASQVTALNLTGRLTPSTPITQMGLTPEGVKTLTPAAAELTKADLVALETGGVKSPAAAKLTVADIASIREAFSTDYRPNVTGKSGIAAMDVSCCSCTPCCCAAAVAAPVAFAA